MSDVDDAFLHWFAGFVAGEGCFQVYKYSEGEYYYARLVVAVRDDDADTLVQIQERLGIGAVYYRAPHKGSSPNARPQCAWRVYSIPECLQLVEIFDHHPLRSSKQADYLVWRDAVRELSKPYKQRNLDFLRYCRDKSRFVKRYRPPEKEPQPDDYEEYQQLTLWQEG